MDNDGFERIYSEYVKPVFRFLFRLSGNYHVAEELTQDTFVRAYQGIDQFRGDCRLFVWLCQIAKNLYYNYAGREARYTDFLEAADMVSELAVEESAVKRKTAEDIADVLRGMPETYQTVFMFRILLQYSFREIGESFLKSEVWARVTYYRAKTMLQERLKEEKGYEM